MNKGKKPDLSDNDEKEKAKREAGLVIAEAKKSKYSDELAVAREEKAELEDVLAIAEKERAKIAVELFIANQEKARWEAKLLIANAEKSIHATEFAFANEEKGNRAAELVIANAEKAKRAAELVIANAEKAKRAAELVIANIEKEHRADELIIADKEIIFQHGEKLKLASELVIADVNRTKREAELVIANIENTKLVAKIIITEAELSFQKKKESKNAAKLVIADAEKAKRSAELVIANIEKARHAAKLVVDNIDKAKRSAELVIANKELVYQNSEKAKRAAELIIAKVLKAKRSAELVVANIEKTKLAAEFVVISKELVLSHEKEKLIEELNTVNEELRNEIEKRMLSEEALRNNYIFNETLLKTIPFGMDIVDEEGTVLFQSDNFKRKFGESAIGKKCWELYREDRKQCIDCPLFKGIIIGETETYESHGVLGGRIFDISHTGILYEGKKAMLEIFQDITERKVTESELIKAKEKAEESDRLKSAFLTNMSHEIRTPMNGILGFAELLIEPNLTIDEQQDYIQTIKISGTRMLNTINSIIDISKIESGLISIDIKETNINEKVEFTYKFFKPEAETKGLQLSYKNGLPAKESNINTDNEKVSGILTNLVRNAIKFTFDGSIEFGYVLKSYSEPGSTEQSRRVELEFFVKDTGIGIPKKLQQLVFERFRQGSESHNRGFEGSGLGLSICKSYAEMLGGRIWVESEEGLGSTFYFNIPYNPVLQETTDNENAVYDENKEAKVKMLKVLIVEDDEISYSLMLRVVQKISKEVLHAATGLEAVEACRNNPDIDVVLMDIRMPDMDGLEATQKIREFNKNVIIIAQTAYGFSSDREKALESGCNDYITKPIDKSLLYEIIKKYTDKLL